MEWIVARWLSFVATLLVTGACVTGLLLLPRTHASASTHDTRDDLARDTAWVGVIAALCFIPATLLRLADQVLALQQPDVPTTESLRLLLGSTTWGTGFLWQSGALLLALTALASATRAPRAQLAWMLGAVGAAGLCATPSMQGHAIGTEPATALAVTADIAHVIGASLWLGTLGVIAVLGVALPNADGVTVPARAARADARLSLLVPLVPRVALPGVTLLLASGVTTTWLHVTTLDDMWRTEWGRYVLAKVLLILVVAGLGALNWRRLGPRMQQAGGVVALRRSLLIELGCSALILLVTAVLVVTPLPGE